MRGIQFLFIISMIISMTTACKSQAQSSNTEASSNKKGQRTPPSIDEIFKMDLDKDGKLSKEEIKGPLLKDFEKIDKDQDGFISREELEAAPKPQRGQRPPRRDN